jgi:hypothetical protein
VDAVRARWIVRVMDDGGNDERGEISCGDLKMMAKRGRSAGQG